MKYKTAKDFIKHHMEIFGAKEWKAESNGQVLKSKGYVEVSGKWVTPYTEVKINGNKPRRR